MVSPSEKPRSRPAPPSPVAGRRRRTGGRATLDGSSGRSPSGGLGTMGYGCPAAIGVQAARPDSL
ncbi:MAG: thiamine pyrophosphate-dependent enzyme, partial [Pseudomonadota bacterium]